MQLKGHSGCKLILKNNIVRKISKDIKYNKRLIEQQKKQQASPFSPEIYTTGYIKDLYFFDMQYIRGESLASFLNTCNVSDISKISNFLIEYIKNNKFSSKSFDSSLFYKTKITQTYQVIKGKNKITHKLFDFLVNFDWSKINKVECHGDLTFENILYSYNNNKIYLIDFLDVFYQTYLADISKLFQDLIVGWSFRNQSIDENLRIRILLLTKNIYNNLVDFLSKRDWNIVSSLLLLDLMRIVPYINDKKTYNFVINSIDSLMNIQEPFYEYINSTMRWPIHEIS